MSIVVHQDAKKNTKQKFSQMVMQFGQFLDHDFTLTPEQERNCADPDLLKADQELDEQLRVCFNIDVEETDEFYANRTQILPITRSDGICNGNVREQLNILTAFIDGSQIYGSDKTFAKKLRQNHFISTLTTRRIKDYTRKASFSFSRFYFKVLSIIIFPFIIFCRDYEDKHSQIPAILLMFLSGK